MNKTGIEWCDMTWNPVTGCRHKCAYCYAERTARRFGKEAEETDDPEHGIHILDGKIKGNPYPFLFEPTFHRYRLGEPTWQKKPQTIFVGSMCDLFGEWVPDEVIEEVFAACEKAPQHRYLFLTKNPARYGRMCELGTLPLKDNFWYGTTCTTRMPFLTFTGSGKAYNTFLSMEPLMGDLTSSTYGGLGIFTKWWIVGAMTGPGAEANKPKREWLDRIAEMADLWNIPLFFKDSIGRAFPGIPMRREIPWRQDA